MSAAFTEDELDMIRHTIARHGDYWVLDYTDDADLERREDIYDAVVQKLGPQPPAPTTSGDDKQQGANDE